MVFSLQQIKKAAQALSQRYREGKTPFLRSQEDRYAYLVTRLPATQAALARVFEELPCADVTSYLDIGAGPGGSWEIARQAFPNLTCATFVEQDREFVKIGKERTPVDQVHWKNESAEMLNVKQHDMVLFSYSWGEIKTTRVLIKAWDLCRKFLVIVEPGTPRGYASMLQAREEIIKQGGHVVAPCPHNHLCPWTGTAQWCHFGVRLERSRQHQQAKEGSRGFEDEKFSYIILAKEKTNAFFGRLLKNFIRRKGHTILALCTRSGIEVKTISKKEKEYKKINKLNWGDKIIDNI